VELDRARVAGTHGPCYPSLAPDSRSTPAANDEAGMFSIFPKSEDFFTLFRKQVALVKQGCDLLHEMLEHYDERDERARGLKDVEHQGDLVTHEIIERLNRTFITPLEREDIHDLASNLDDVLDAVEALASRFVLFNIKEVTPEARQLAAILQRSGVQIEQAVNNLEDLKNLIGFTIEINRLENEADALSRAVVADLFVPGKHDLLDVMCWKEMYGRLEGAADRCEDVANTIESIVLKNR
jgi:predicted phosphate transport protein (TIGR00153 family)